MKKITQKPIDRSLLRLKIGAFYFTLKRYLFWIFGGLKFAKAETTEFKEVYFSHETPLIRKLKDVDMYLQYNKITNLKIAVKKLNKVVIHPGETFSYWRLIGRPTKAKGYLEGMILQNGGFKGGIGGGLCQLSNLIYWLTIHTPLTVVERHRHGYDVFPDAQRTQPFGSGATCFYNYKDLMIQNNTEENYQLFVWVTEEKLKGQWCCDKKAQYTYKVYEKEHIIQPEYWGGYTRHNLIYREKYDLAENFIADEYVVENHAVMMYAPLVATEKASLF